MARRSSYDPFKRLLDIVASALLLPILSPFLLLEAIVVRVGMGPGKVIFRQMRPGRRGRLFPMYKFRTMTEARDSEGNLLPDAERLNRTGKVLRSLSLDELPELYNVLLGQMSVVGPRPLLADYLELYTEEQARRHEVRPGITGWAQVNGRNALGWEERFEMDVWYVDHRSFFLDLKILVMTIAQVFRRHGISEEGQATMSKFTGSPQSSSGRSQAGGSQS